MNIKEYLHPDYGVFRLDGVTWQKMHAMVSFLEYPLAISLEDSFGAGPSKESLEALEWMDNNWQTVLLAIKEQAACFYKQKTGASIIQNIPFDAPKGSWNDSTVSSIRINSKNEFYVTMRFSWQDERDRREVTFPVIDSLCKIHSL